MDKKWTAAVLTAIVALTATAACAADDTPLEGTDWKLVWLGKTPVKGASPNQQAHLVFDAKTHRVSGSGGCNRLMGGYELNGKQLKFTQIAGTMMACDEGMETEDAFHKALAQVTGWKIAGGQLELLDAAGKTLARLEARPAAAK